MLYSYGKLWSDWFLPLTTFYSLDPAEGFAADISGNRLTCSKSGARIVIPLKLNPGDVITGIRALWSSAETLNDSLWLTLSHDEFGAGQESWEPLAEHTFTPGPPYHGPEIASFEFTPITVQEGKVYCILIEYYTTHNTCVLWGVGIQTSTRVY